MTVETVTALDSASAGGGLLGKLLAAVRPEFRVEIYLPAPDDPVLGRPGCAVPGCDRSGWEYRLCGGHSNRWRKRGRPELAGFLADPGPPLQGRIQTDPLHACPAAASAAVGLGLCMRHRSAWARSRPPRPRGLGRRPPGRGPGRARRVRAAVLHAVVRERQAPVLQVPRDPMAASWAAPRWRTTSRTACCAGGPASTSAGWPRSPDWSCSTPSSAATTSRPSPRRRRW